jgi:hypothetical protein
MRPHEPKGLFRGCARVAATSDGPQPPDPVGTVATVAQRLVCNRYAVSTALPFSATMASLRSAPIVFHGLYYVIYECAVVCEYAVYECRIYPLWRNWLTFTHTVVGLYYPQRRSGSGSWAENTQAGGGTARPYILCRAENGQGAAGSPRGD